MTHEELKNELSVIEEQIRESKRKSMQLKKDFIEQHKDEYPIGAKVAVHHRGSEDEYGIVIGHTFSYNNDFEPILAKMKKDGTAHATARIYLWGNDFELVKEID